MGPISDWAKVFSGVQKGSVLARLLFLAFVNDLPYWIVNSVKMFADNMKNWTGITKAQDYTCNRICVNW